MKRQILKLTTEPTDEPILGTSAEADAWGRRKFIIFQKLPQFFTHHSLVLWRRSQFQDWLLSWSSRLLNQGVRYFPFLFECWVFAFFLAKRAEIQNPWSVTCFVKSQTGTNDVTKLLGSLLSLSSEVQWRKTCRLQWFFVSGCFLAFCSFISLQVSCSSTKLYDMPKYRYLRLQSIGK